MNFRRSEERGIRSIPRLSLVAFIDIVLFLLLYLMLAGTLTAPESRISAGLEKAAAPGAKAPDLPPVSLRVARAGSSVVFRIGQRDLPSFDALVVALAQSPKQGGLIVRSDANTFVGDIAAAMQAAKDAGFDRVSYAPTP
ncbi:MAG: biopolymer transporter ExbD [Phycisphaeraceae bacterium]|nr:biopolymer transporter ExbD [Phycisphaeraceae bacterium]